MSANTPRGYTYPYYTDLANAPSQIQDLATDIDTDHTVIATDILDAQHAPSVNLTKAVIQSIAANTNVTVTWNTEVFDNNSMANLGVDNTRIQLQTPGYYLISGYVQMGVAASGAMSVTLTSSGGVSLNPVAMSRAFDNDKGTGMSWCVLHWAPVTPDNVTVVVRHNGPAAVDVQGASLSATKVAD